MSELSRGLFKTGLIRSSPVLVYGYAESGFREFSSHPFMIWNGNPPYPYVIRLRDLICTDAGWGMYYGNPVVKTQIPPSKDLLSAALRNHPANGIPWGQPGKIEVEVNEGCEKKIEECLRIERMLGNRIMERVWEGVNAEKSGIKKKEAPMIYASIIKASGIKPYCSRESWELIISQHSNE
jgi:hypothetical protein